MGKCEYALSHSHLGFLKTHGNAFNCILANFILQKQDKVCQISDSIFKKNEVHFFGCFSLCQIWGFCPGCGFLLSGWI
jgi:hypothetical protein